LRLLKRLVISDMNRFLLVKIGLYVSAQHFGVDTERSYYREFLNDLIGQLVDSGCIVGVDLYASLGGLSFDEGHEITG
jgi:hypothetical protein